MTMKIANLKASSSLLFLIKSNARIRYEWGQYEYILRRNTMGKNQIVLEKFFGNYRMMGNRYPFNNAGLAQALKDMKIEMHIE